MTPKPDLSARDLTYHYDERLRPIADDPDRMAEAARALAHDARSPDLPAPVRARRLGVAAYCVAMLGDLESARAMLHAALELDAVAPDPRHEVALRLRLAQVNQWAGRYAEAEGEFASQIDRCRADRRLTGHLDFALQHAGKCAYEQGKLPVALALLGEALALREAKGDPELIASTRLALERAREAAGAGQR